MVADWRGGLEICLRAMVAIGVKQKKPGIVEADVNIENVDFPTCDSELA